MRRLGLVASLLALASTSLAQGALVDTSIVGPGGLCLDVAGTFDAAHPPPAGTPLVLRACDGRDTQRWRYNVGDYEGDLIAFTFDTVVDRGGRAVLGDQDHGRAAIGGGRLGLAGGRCLASAMPPVAGAPLMAAQCDGSPGQHFERVP
jgi:hypothetical protein